MTDSSPGDTPKPIGERTIDEYLEALTTSSPAPGGGSVAGLTGALAAGLGQMVVSLTDDEEASAALGSTSDDLAVLHAALLAESEADERAYSGYVEAAKLPKGSRDEKDVRRAAMQAALKRSGKVPMRIAEAALAILQHLELVARHGNRQALSDAEIAVLLAHVAVQAGLATVRVNIPLIKDRELSAGFEARADDIEKRASQVAQHCRQVLSERGNG